MFPFTRPFVQVGDDFAEGLEAQRFLFLGDDARENGNRPAVEPWMTSRLAIIEYRIFPLAPTVAWAVNGVVNPISYEHDAQYSRSVLGRALACRSDAYDNDA
jgi:hypothetical protein